MEESFILNRVRALSKNWKFLLLLITAVAIIIRSLPGWTSPAWGGDFGIYYGLTNSFIDTKSFYNPYLGWGASYQYFPVLYVITGIAHWITGIDVITIMPRLIPIFGGLSVGIFYFVVYELLNNRRSALLAASFFAVLPFHVLQTSHAAPLTLGHFFMMLSLLFFIKYRQNNKYLIPLVLSTGLLIASHHLTTYMYMISLVFIVLSENASSKTWTKTIKKDTICILATTIFTFAYWRFFAPVVFDQFMKGGINLGFGKTSPAIIILLFYSAILLMFLLIVMKRRLHVFSKIREISNKTSKVFFFSTIAFFISLMVLFTFVDAPILDHKFEPLAVLYSIPVILIFGLTVVGFPRLRFTKNGNFIRGWMYALVISFLFALVTNGRIEHFRHFEYMMAPISIIAIYGLGRLFKDLHFEFIWGRNFKLTSHKIMSYKKFIYVGFIALLVSANATTVYPGHTAMNMGYKVITEEDLSATEWISSNIPCNNTVFASDHRIERMLEAAGYNTTKNKASLIWTEVNLSEYISHLDSETYEFKVTHVVIDDVMREKYVQKQDKKTVFDYMTNGSYEKFFSPPFSLLYRNETLNKNNETIHWTEVYAVDWTYIDNYIYD